MSTKAALLVRRMSMEEGSKRPAAVVLLYPGYGGRAACIDGNMNTTEH
jgi:hypothetical protein